MKIPVFRSRQYNYDAKADQQKHKDTKITHAKVREFLRCAYYLAMRGEENIITFVSAYLTIKARRYKDERVSILVDPEEKRMEIIWFGKDRKKKGYDDGVDNPVVMLASPWALIRRHGETACIEDHVIEQAKKEGYQQEKQNAAKMPV